MALSATLYNMFFKKTSSFVLTVCAGTFFFERITDGFTEALFDSINKGKQWKDIKHLYEKQPDQE